MIFDVDDFLALLKQVRARRDEELAANYHRSLPLGDALFDRWERARALGFGSGASIYDSALVFGSVHVGGNSWIGPNVMLDGSGGTLEIGAWCSISTGVHIYTHDAAMWSVTAGRTPRRTAPVAIGDCCFVGAQTVIGLGVTIGDQCVIGANSFVNRNVPPRHIYAGSPARRIGVVVEDENGEWAFRYD